MWSGPALSELVLKLVMTAREQCEASSGCLRKPPVLERGAAGWLLLALSG